VGGNVKDTTVRCFRSSLDLSAHAKPSPLSFHRAHLSLRYQKTKMKNYET
jgi:hypothetical protein